MKFLTIIFPAILIFGLLISGTGLSAERKDTERHEKSEVIGELTTKIHGTIEKLPADGRIGTWTVKGKKVNVTKDTHINENQGKIAVGVYIEVEGNSKGDSIDAYEIEVESEKVLHGKIEKLPEGSLYGAWTVNGKKVYVTKDTHIDKADQKQIAVGVSVDIEGELRGDAINAFEIELPDQKK